MHRSSLPGKPDVVLPRLRAAVFVHGCFWHGHDCKDGRRPKSNTEYWNKKLDRNRVRDEEVRAKLAALGWRGFVIWGCETGRPEALKRLLKEVML